MEVVGRRCAGRRMCKDLESVLLVLGEAVDRDVSDMLAQALSHVVAFVGFASLLILASE